MKPYLYLSGLERLVHEVRGDEAIHVGIRPYGFHAGNIMALVVYPYLLCRLFESMAKMPRFKFIISLNDWEQDALAGPDYRKYPFNIHPKNTSLEFTPDDNGCCSSIVRHWEPIIKSNMLWVQKRFPHTSFIFVKNSNLLQYPICKKLLMETLRHPRRQAKIFEQYSKKKLLEDPIQYAGVICPRCHRSLGRTDVAPRDMIRWACFECAMTRIGRIEDFSYWWYHKPMLIARIVAFRIDVTLSGGDHFSEGDFKIRRALLRTYAPSIKEPKMLFTPTVIALDGQKMSKSRNNTAFVEVGEFIRAAQNYKRKEFFISSELIRKNVDKKDYSSIL